MITVDDRAGSAELLSLFPAGTAQLGRLSFGDFMFLGNGPDETMASIGIERKAICDFLSSMSTGRFSGHQLPGLLNSYQYVYVILEGLWRFNPASGVVEGRRGQGWEALALGPRTFKPNEFIGFINSLVLRAGVHVITSGSRRETVQVVMSLHHWWTSKQWDEHVSHLAPQKSHHGSADFVRPSLVRRVAAELPGIGWGRSRDVDAHFPNMATMALATAKEWRRVPGIGKILASRIVEEIWKEESS